VHYSLASEAVRDVLRTLYGIYCAPQTASP